MNRTIVLYGALRDLHHGNALSLEMADHARAADLRTALLAHARAHWPPHGAALLQVSVLATEECVLRDGELLPSTGAIAVLPPVSGG